MNGCDQVLCLSQFRRVAQILVLQNSLAHLPSAKHKAWLQRSKRMEPCLHYRVHYYGSLGRSNLSLKTNHKVEFILLITLFELSYLQFSVNVISPLLCFCFTTLWLVKKIRAFFLTFQPVRTLKSQRIVTCLHALFRAWNHILVFASKSDWFIALFTCVVIGQINNSGFGFMIWFYVLSKPLLLGTFQQCE